MVSLHLFLLTTLLQTTRGYDYILNNDCNHYYDKPIDVCFSTLSSLKGLLSHKYSCYISNTTTWHSIKLNTYNNTADCRHSQLMNSTILYNLTTDDLNGTGPLLNPFVSCRAEKSCPYFKGRYYLTKILTDAPTVDPTAYPSTTDMDSTLSTTDMNGTLSVTDFSPYLENETCARNEYYDYYQEIVYLVDVCLPYQPPENNLNSTANDSNIFGVNDTVYYKNMCNKNPYGTPLTITNAFYYNETCNNSIANNTLNTLYSNGECYNYTDTTMDVGDVQHILFDSETDYFKLSILECDYLPDGASYPDEFRLYEFDLIFSWIVWLTASLMLLVYTIYVLDGCRTVKKKSQYKETGLMVLDDYFSQSRLAVLSFQWFALFTLWLNASFSLVNAWSYIEMDHVEQCNLMMSALDLSWHWGKGFLYLSLMCRVVLIMEGLSDQYEIPKKILKLFAFEVVAYFMLTPILDLVTTRADHRLHFFIDERSEEPLFVCGEVIEYWVSFLLFFGDLLLCSTTIGVYLYALGELVMNPIQNQKLIDMLIRYAIFSIFASIWIMIANGIWATNNYTIGRYIDTLFSILTIMFTLTMCTGCYTQCCSGCHKRMRRSYIVSFMKLKQKFITKEMNEIKNNPKYVLKSYDKSFDTKLSKILTPSNLTANKSLDRYHQNVALHHMNSTIRSKKKLRKIHKKMKRSMKDLEIDGVNLDDRDMDTMQHLITFRTNEKFMKRDEASSVEMSKNIEETVTTTMGSIATTRQQRGILAHLNPAESTLPTALTIAIHASAVENLKNKKHDARISDKVKETVKYKAHKKMESIWTKVDTYYDENNIVFCRRSPTIFPGIAYKLSKAEKFALKERQDVIEGNEYSKSDDYSDSADTDDEMAFDAERIWPNASRKYGQRKSLDDIYEILCEMPDKEVETIWDLFDRERQRRMDYRDSLVKLLGAFFLLYFRKKLHHQKKQRDVAHEDKVEDKDIPYVQLHLQPPRYDELEPLLVVLAKYIRDALRKKKRKCLKKGDFQRNFISKYLKDAIEKRNKMLNSRNNKLQSISPHSSRMPAMTPFSSDDGKIEERPGHEAMNTQELAFLGGTKSAVRRMFNDDDAAGREIEKRISTYKGRESANKYGYRASGDAYEERALKIDKDMEALQEKRRSGRPLMSEMQPMTMDIVDTPEDDMDVDELNVEDILMDVADTPVTKKSKAQATPSESSAFDVNALMADLKGNSKAMLNTPQSPPSTNLAVAGASTSEVSMDMAMIDGLISDLTAIEEHKEEETKEEKEEEEEKQHDTQGTEIINMDVVTPKKSKVVVIDEDLIKQDTFKIDANLFNEVMDEIETMHDKEEEEIDDVKEEAKQQQQAEHNKQSDTVQTVLEVEVKHDAQVSSAGDWHIDAQLMDDVLDVTFAVDDSDESDEDP